MPKTQLVAIVIERIKLDDHTSFMPKVRTYKKIKY